MAVFSPMVLRHTGVALAALLAATGLSWAQPMGDAVPDTGEFKALVRRPRPGNHWDARGCGQILGPAHLLAGPAPCYDSVTGRPGRLIVPGGQYQVMISTTSRPATTAGSASASCRDCSIEPVR